VGKENSLLLILRKLIYLYATKGKGYTVHFITDENVDMYIPTIPDYYHSLIPAHKADFIRIHVVCDYGGIWMDSDTLVMDTMDSLFSILQEKDGFFITENNNVIWNGVFGSKKNTPLMLALKKQMYHILARKKSVLNWSDIGPEMYTNIYISNPALFGNYIIFSGLNTVYPIDWHKCVEEFLEKPYENYKNIIRPYQPFVVLVNSVYKKWEDMSEEDIMNSNTPLQYFLQTSFTNLESI